MLAPRITFVLLIACLALAGCTQPTIFANPDPNLRKSNSQFRDDASARFPYRMDAPRATEPKARATVGYSLNRLELVNFSGQDWENVEIWVNRQYVCYIPVLEDRKLKEIHFPMLYDGAGNRFPKNNSQVRVETVELYRDGKMHSIVSYVGDR